MTISSREKTIFAFCIASVLGVLLYVLALEPILASWEKVNREIRRREIRIQKISKVIKKKEILEARLNELKKRAKLGIPKEEWETALFTSLDAMARDSGVIILNRTSHPSREHGFYQELSTDLEMECNLDTLSKFLYQMETSAQILNVETLRLNPKGRGSSKLNGQMSISTIQLLGDTQ